MFFHMLGTKPIIRTNDGSLSVEALEKKLEWDLLQITLTSISISDEGAVRVPFDVVGNLIR